VQTDVQRGAGAKIPLSQFLQAMGFAQELFVFVFGAAQRCAPLHVAVRRSVVGSSALTGASRRSPFAVRSLDRLCVPVPGIVVFFFGGAPGIEVPEWLPSIGYHSVFCYKIILKGEISGYNLSFLNSILANGLFFNDSYHLAILFSRI
jgi:hypothetical protein